MRSGNLKLVFCEQKTPGTLAIWREPFTCLRGPKPFNLRMDPYERADITSNTYYDWFIRRAYIMGAAQSYIGEFLGTFKEFPQRQKAASFNLDEVMQMLSKPGGG